MAETTATDPLEGLRARAEAAADLTDWDAVALMRDAVARRREHDLVIAQVAADLGARSPAGPGGMARRRGFKGVDQLIAAETGGTVAEAERLRILGTALFGRPDDAPGGASVLPHLAWAARERRLSADAFVLLRSVLMTHPDARDADGLPVSDAVRATPLGRVPLARVERMAVDKAVTVPLRSIRSLVAQFEAGLTPPVVAEERYEEQFQMRQASTREEADGMIRLTALLDPMTAAPLLAALDGYLKKAFRSARDADEVDARTPSQLRADALGWLGRHANGCRKPHDAVKTTVSIRMTLADLTGGDGYGSVDGLDKPVPVGVLRRHAADAQIVPTILGMGSEILDHGRAQRLFTAAQRRAIAERDRGCAYCGAPPSHCDVHHVTEFQYGGLTDVRDGLMLCVACHHWFHRERWGLRWREDGPEFVPSASYGPERKPRPGYRRQVTFTEQDMAALGRDGPP
ncbi:HNH endonuclease [Demequina maris]|uniref:HNH endonuclease n=1 Tax=Demequina maris TaxID=1638982 RepID=UPI0007849461|nr:HNH endonuclease signature motif containing protein [Demequina maris]